jgi:hypothetical protein
MTERTFGNATLVLAIETCRRAIEACEFIITKFPNDSECAKAVKVKAELEQLRNKLRLLIG